jgi:hypothetical protein
MEPQAKKEDAGTQPCTTELIGVSRQSKHRCNLLAPQLPGIKAAMKDDIFSSCDRQQPACIIYSDLCLLVDLQKILMLVLCSCSRMLRGFLACSVFLCFCEYKVDKYLCVFVL